MPQPREQAGKVTDGDARKMQVTRQDIVAGLVRLGLGSGDLALVHSSLSSFGHVVGGADAVIDALLETVGPRGTIAMPTLTGSPDFNPTNPPVIDLAKTPCWTGMIPETFRQRPTAARSVHPTHSVSAIGPLAEWLCATHHLSPTSCGATSPYWRLAQAGGYIVLAGCGFESCTTLHCAEELSTLAYILQDGVTFARVIVADGREIEVACRLHDYGAPARRFDRIEKPLLERGILRIGTIGASTVRVVRAMSMLETAFEYIQKDPYFLTVKAASPQ